MAGTALHTAKRALVDLFAAQEGLATVRVSYGPPSRPVDLTGASGSLEAVWLGDANVSAEIPGVAGGLVYYDETISLEVIAQVLMPRSAGTAERADERLAEIMAEMQEALANTPTLGDTSSYHLEATYDGGYDHAVGLVGEHGFGSRAELAVEIQARLDPS